MPYMFFGIKTDGSASVLFGTPHFAFGYDSPLVQRNVVLNQQTGGTIDADLMSGYDGDIITLSNTADAGYTFNTYNLTGATLTGNQFMFSGSDVTAEPDYTHNVYSVSITQVAGGTVAASPSTGYYGTQVTLSNTPSSEYTFGSYSITGATLTGNTFNFEESNVTAKGSFTQKTYTLTLQTDGHGKLVASKVTGHKNDTITLTPSYSSYYRFNNYSVTGGSVNGNTFTITANATAKANFKVNAFTATGTFNALNLSRNNTTAAVTGTSNGILKAFTGSKPSNWPATNGNWNVSNASAYGIKANTTWNLARGGSIVCSGWAAVRLNGTNKATGNTKLTGTISKGGASTSLNCNMAYNSTQGQIAVTAQLQCGSNGRYDFTWKLGSNGWTATGNAP